MKKHTFSISSCLIKTEKRPAKVGEYVLIVKRLGFSKEKYEVGKIYKAVDVHVLTKALEFEFGGAMAMPEEYLVIPDYQPEKEPEPAGWNGKVVCVDHGGYSDLYTAGKIYTFTDGQMTNDVGRRSNSSYKRKSFEELEANFFCQIHPLSR